MFFDRGHHKEVKVLYVLFESQSSSVEGRDKNVCRTNGRISSLTFATQTIAGRQSGSNDTDGGGDDPEISCVVDWCQTIAAEALQADQFVGQGVVDRHHVCQWRQKV